MGDFEKVILLISSSVLWGGLAGIAFIGLIVCVRFQLWIVRWVWQQVRRLGVVSLAVAGLLTGVSTLHGGPKNTNGVQPRTGVTMRVTGMAGTSTNGLGPVGIVCQTITDEDISNGWRVVSMSTNALGGLVGTFLGAAVDDDSSQIANAQFELSPSDGRLVFRYDLSRVRDGPFLVGPFDNGTNHFVTVSSNTSEIVFQRVHPDDWDMDGLANAIDDDPRVAATNAGWNQSTTWAMRAFPSNAVEIATNGYPAWAWSQAAEPNRHLIGLHVASPNGVWPICLSFGGVPVMCDGEETIFFSIDDGAHYPFLFSTGELEFVSLPNEPIAQEPCWSSRYPYERWIGPVVTHLDSPGSGWIGRTAEVEIDDSTLSHFFPSRSQTVTATVTNCHADAYLGCEWHGGTGWTFGDPHALSTTATWNGDDVWATNGFSLVTSYRGWYTLTNFIPITVGTQVEPDTTFSISCQEVFFLNDADFLSGGSCSSNRPERIRPVALKLTAPSGTAGNVTLVAGGTAEPIVLTVSELGVTNRVEATNSIPLNVTDPFARTGSASVLVSCPKLGRGTLTATWTSTNGEARTATADFRCIEPLRKLVTTERTGDNRFINPSRLVYGTNAVLRVGVNCGTGSGASFTADEVCWSVVSGPGRVSSPTNGWEVTVEPTATSGEVVVEARFNDDEIQPRFIMPIVKKRMIPLVVYVCVNGGHKAITDSDLEQMVQYANQIYQQVGIGFEVVSTNEVNDASFWNLAEYDCVTNSLGQIEMVISEQAKRLLNQDQSQTGIEIYFVGKITSGKAYAFSTGQGLVISQLATAHVFAHEIGHRFGLQDCYDMRYAAQRHPPHYVGIIGYYQPVSNSFMRAPADWGFETGRGFFEDSDTRTSVMRKFLMYGMDGRGGIDIPAHDVESMRKDANYSSETFRAKVGAEYLEKDDEKVKTK